MYMVFVHLVYTQFMRVLYLGVLDTFTHPYNNIHFTLDVQILFAILSTIKVVVSFQAFLYVMYNTSV